MDNMLRIIQNATAAGAKSYYSTADYYTEGQELAGIWHGKGAERLGLQGSIEKREWDALCDNLDPATGTRLTARQKDSRRVGYDINFHAPKSLSLVYGLTQDPRILEAFRDAVNSTMESMEFEMQARVRVDGKQEDRTTGNMLWGEFVHTTARPVDGVPDPHLHAHAFCFNVTFDEKESRWKAGQFGQLKRDAPYFEAMFHSRLSHNLVELGLPIERTKKGWELQGIPASALKKFSRRTTLIEEKAKALGIVDPDQKGELGARTRSGKIKELTAAELREIWRSRLSEDEGDHVSRVADRIGDRVVSFERLQAKDAVAMAMKHCFERQSVVPEREIVRAALRSSYGSVTLDQIERAVESAPLLRASREGRVVVTTPEVLAEEKSVIDFARDGRGTCAPFAIGKHTFRRDWLNLDQQKAVEHVLHSLDRVTVIRGGAGTGKTSSLQELAEAIESIGKRVYAFAPSAEASRTVLRNDGFKSADTVARLLVDSELQQRIEGQVLLIDEAGLLSMPDTKRLFDLAEQHKARVILSGDRGQHGSVQRGSMLKVLEEEAGVVPAEIREIQRQRGDYKEAVRALSRGRIDVGFQELDRLGWVREVPDADRYDVLARDYVAAIAEGKTALVVSPTHVESEQTAQAIRDRLRADGQIGSDEREIRVLTNRHFTEAERSDPAMIDPTDVLVFHQNAVGFDRGERMAVGDRSLPASEALKYQVFRSGALKVAPGDLIRVTRNGTTADGKHRLNNGSVHSVKGFDPNGNLVLRNGWVIGKDFGFLSQGYVVTSHAAQGRTVDRVLIAESSSSFPAASPVQFYVSVSRGRESARIYTDSREELLENVRRANERLVATDIARFGGLEAPQRRQDRASRAIEQRNQLEISRE